MVKSKVYYLTMKNLDFCRGQNSDHSATVIFDIKFYHGLGQIILQRRAPPRSAAAAAKF